MGARYIGMKVGKDSAKNVVVINDFDYIQGGASKVAHTNS